MPTSLSEDRKSAVGRLTDDFNRRLAALTSRQLAFALVCVVLLVALPVALTLAREDRFESRIKVIKAIGSPEAESRWIPSGLEAWVLELARTKHVTRTAGRQVDFALDSSAVAKNTRVINGNSPTSVFLVAEGRTPERAKELADVVARLVASLSRAELESRIRADLQRVLVRGTRSDLSRAERVKLGRRIDEFGRVLDGLGRPLALAKEGASTPAVTTTVDKAVNRLPGEFPPSPSPVWAGVAGLLLAVASFAVWLFFLPPRRGLAAP